MAGIEISTVSSRSDLDRFIDLPWKIYAGDNNWVPPLKKQVRRILDTSVHPFWKFSERELFLARRGSEVVGRIAAIVDNNYNSFHDEKMGAWGFFECENDPEAAAALFSAAEMWTSGKGMTFLRGPLNPSTNYEVGMLIEGFESPPTVMMTYNPTYYIPLVESCGFEKEKDLVAILVLPNDRADARVQRLASRVTRNKNIYVRTANKKAFDSEMEIVKEIYNSAWSRNWGFVPMTEEEMTDMGKELVPVMDPELVFFIYYDDQAVGVALVLPDVNPLLKRLNGKIGIRGLLKILLHRKEIKGLRGLILGFKRSHQRLGLPLVAFDHINRVARGKYEYLELGWNLEDNDDINKFEIQAGGRIHKKYRIFRKTLVPEGI
ncbi:MAG: acyl-CoA N-acyltransferase [Desulfomonile tiedjei]|uniref:Acyl-CoA N-acyltransferase n=1 Tax=Desulfomonile tiedjei TaxID=2358 RepID=A0A9D6UYH1_9BACT|nr:acyl-CoA N-acyltransferase [Desulfomonile tiedjei]